MYWVRVVHQSLDSQAPLPPSHLVLELCIGLSLFIKVWPVKHQYHHPTPPLPNVPIRPYLSMDVLCFATKYNSNTIYDHGEILWENVAPYWPVMWFSRFWRKISLSLLDWWDSETQISFSSRFSRCWEKILFLFSIYEIFENNSLSLLNFQDF